MTTNQNVDNFQNEDADGTNQSVPNSGNGSINGADAMAQLLDAKLAEALKPVLAEVRGVQGRQDKDRKGFQEFLDEYRKQKAKGLSDSEAETAAQSSLDERKATQTDKELLRKIAEKVLGPSFAGNEPSAHASIVEQYNLDANDPEVIASVLTQTDPKDAEIAAARLMNRRQSQPSASASAASTIVSTPSAPANVDSLTIQYQKEMSAAQGNPSLARALKAEYAKRGVPVDAVVFH